MQGCAPPARPRPRVSQTTPTHPPGGRSPFPPRFTPPGEGLRPHLVVPAVYRRYELHGERSSTAQPYRSCFAPCLLWQAFYSILTLEQRIQLGERVQAIGRDVEFDIEKFIVTTLPFGINCIRLMFLALGMKGLFRSGYLLVFHCTLLSQNLNTFDYFPKFTAKWRGLGRGALKSCFPGDTVWPTLSELGCSPCSGRRRGHLKVPATAGQCQGWLRVYSLFFFFGVCVALIFSFLFQPTPLPSALYISHSTHSLADRFWFPTPSSSTHTFFLLDTPHFVGAPRQGSFQPQTEQASYCLLGREQVEQVQ